MERIERGREEEAIKETEEVERIRVRLAEREKEEDDTSDVMGGSSDTEDEASQSATVDDAVILTTEGAAR